MKRIAVLAVLAAVVACICAPPVQARGLYVGDGRISKHPLYNPFTVRLNGSIGWQGAFQAKSADYYLGPGMPVAVSYGYGDWQFGNYGSAGIEFNLGDGVSFEAYGLYRYIDGNDNYVSFTGVGGAGIYQSIESKVYGAGGNFRFYKNWKGGAAYLGLGGGYAHGEAEWASYGPSTQALIRQQDSGDFQLLAGLDLHLSRLSIGFETGWRWSGLDGFNEFEGAFLGARAGIMFGSGD